MMAESALTTTEAQQLAQYEAVIEHGIQTFVEVGLALLAVREARLYREQYSTFEEYCQSRWGWTRRHTNRLIASAEVTTNLGPIGPNLPVTESQARPLVALRDQPELQREVWRRAVETAPDGKVTAAHVQAVVDSVQPEKQRAQQAMGATVYSHGSLEYYTPRYVTDAARLVMGDIDLDPASCEMAQEWIGAHRYYTQRDDGLAQPWYGRVWLNPPYSYTDGRSNQDLWSERLISQYEIGNVEQGILLVKAALGYKWFERLWDDWPVCFMRDRLSFVLPNGSDDGQSKQATAIFYVGPYTRRFIEVFGAMGRVILPEDQKRG